MSELTFKDLSAELTQAIGSQLDVPEGTEARCTLGREKVMVLIESPSVASSPQKQLSPEETLSWLEQSLRQQFDTIGLPEEAAELAESGEAVPVQLFLKYASEPKPFMARSFDWQVSDSFDDLFGDILDSDESESGKDEPVFQDATGSLAASYDALVHEQAISTEPVDVFADIPDADSYEEASTLSSMDLLLSEEDDSVPLELDDEHLQLDLEPDELETDELEAGALRTETLETNALETDALETDALASMSPRENTTIDIVPDSEDVFLPLDVIDDPDLTGFEAEEGMSDFSLPGDEPQISSSDLDLPAVDFPAVRSQDSASSDEGFFDVELDRASDLTTTGDSELAADFEEAFDRTHGEAAEIAAADLVEDIFDSSLNALEEESSGEIATHETFGTERSEQTTHEIAGFEPSSARTDLLLELETSPVKLVDRTYGLADSSGNAAGGTAGWSDWTGGRDEGDRESLEDDFDFLTPDLSDEPLNELEDEDAPGEDIFDSTEDEDESWRSDATDINFDQILSSPTEQIESESRASEEDDRSFEELSSAENFAEEALSEPALSEAAYLTTGLETTDPAEPALETTEKASDLEEASPAEAESADEDSSTENSAETAVGFDQYGSEEYRSDADGLSEDDDSPADDETVGDLSESELYQLERDTADAVLDENVALIDEREVQRQREQWQQQTRRNPWVFAGAIGFLVIGVLGFVLSRPCSFGACPRLQTARSEGERALSSLSLGANLESVKSAKQQLNRSVRQLQPIPVWSPHYSEANAVLPEFKRQLSALDRVTAAQEEAYSAAVASQNPPHSAKRWGEIAQMWRDAIATLERVPADNSVRRLAEQKLTEYRANLSTIKVRIDAEAKAEERLQAAQAAASLATATAQQASTLEAWESALENWESAVSNLGLIPKGTQAYADAQNLLAEYRRQMETVRDRTLQERNASQGLSRAQQLATDAERVESEDQWTVAVQTWTAAVNQIRDLTEGTIAHREAQPLMAIYRQSLEKAESNRQVAERFQPVEPSFYAACGATSAKRCSYSVRGGNVRLDLFQGYDSAINQSITPPDQRAEVTIDSDVVTQSNQLLKEITLLSTQTQVPIELYDAKGEFLARYRPDLSGFVKEQDT